MSQPFASSFSQKIIRCSLNNIGNMTNERLIELELFKLWSYVMQHRHGFKIKDISLCLWVSQQEFQSKEVIYTHSSLISEANMLTMLIFDEKNEFCHTISRYTLKEDTATVKDIILSHLSKKIIEDKNYELITTPGHLLEKKKNITTDLALGLSGEQFII